MKGNKDLLWISITMVLILTWSSLPTWAGHFFETPELRFRGLHYDSRDYAVHIAMMASGAHGELAYQFRFTTEAHKPSYIRMFYIVLGHISRLTGLSLETVYHFARWVLGFTALFSLHELMKYVFRDNYWSRIGFLMSAMGSGLGWFQLLIGWTPGKITPIDFWFTDDYVFFSLSIFPHFSFVLTGICCILILWLQFLEKPKWTNISVIGLIVVMVQFVNPIALAAVDAGLFGAVLFSWWSTGKLSFKYLAALIMIALIHLPLLTYNFLILSQDPLWSQFTAQNQTLSPPPEYFFWGYAIFWPMAIAGIVNSFRTKNNSSGAAIFWIISAFLLAYSPVNIQRRFLQGITIPLGLLATMGLRILVEKVFSGKQLKKQWKSIVVILFLVLISMSSIQLVLGRITYLGTRPDSYYYPASLDSAIDWLRENAQYNDFVLASEPTSQVLSQKAGMRVYLGHEMETLYYEAKQEQVDSFFRGNGTEFGMAPVRWVIYGPYEQAINSDFQPGPYLDLVYTINDLRIYKVK